MHEKITPGSFTFPRYRRLLTPSQFQRVYASGYRLNADAYTLIFLPNSCETGRLGISIHRRIRGAVKRNRIKRIIREFYRLSLELDQRLVTTCPKNAKSDQGPAPTEGTAEETPLDLVITVRPGYSLDNLGEFTRVMEKALSKQSRRRHYAPRATKKTRARTGMT